MNLASAARDVGFWSGSQTIACETRNRILNGVLEEKKAEANSPAAIAIVTVQRSVMFEQNGS